MSTMHSTVPHFGLEFAPRPFVLRLGRRELSMTRDFRKRFYPVNPLIECDAGLTPGHVEVLLFGRWLLVLSQAR